MQTDMNSDTFSTDGHHSFTNQKNPSFSGAEQSNRDCTGDDAHFNVRSPRSTNLGSNGHTYDIIGYCAPPRGGWLQTPENIRDQARNHNVFGCASPLFPVGKDSEGEKSQEVEQQDTSDGVARNDLSSPGCIRHGTTVYGGKSHAVYHLDSNLSRGGEGGDAYRGTSAGNVVQPPVINRSRATASNLLGMGPHDTQGLGSIENGRCGGGGQGPALCGEWNRNTNTGAARTEEILPKQKIGLVDHGDEGSTGRGVVTRPGSKCQIDSVAEDHDRCLHRVPEKNAATATGLLPTDITPQYHDIDRRLLDGYWECRGFHPHKIAPQKALFEDVSEQPGGTIPMDTTKRRHIEAALTARGLTLLSEYPVSSQLLVYAKQEVILATPLFQN